MLLIGWFGLPRDADIMSLPTPINHGTLQDAVFALPCCFNHSTSGVNVKYIYQRSLADLDYCVVSVDPVGVFLNKYIEL